MHPDHMSPTPAAASTTAPDGRTATETLSVADHVAAATASLRALQLAVDARLDASPLAILDRALDSAGRWGFRLVFALIPLIIAVPLLLLPGTRWIGVLALLAAPIGFVLAVVVERLFGRVSSAVESSIDESIDRAGARELARRLPREVEAGTLRLLTGEVTLRLEGEQLTATATGHAVTIPSVRSAWVVETPEHLVLAPRQPAHRRDIADQVLVSPESELGTAIQAIRAARH